MELDNGKGAFLARLFLINIPIILLLGTGLMSVFLIILTWLPVIISGGLVILGWIVLLVFRLTSVKIRLNPDRITVLYYPIRIIGHNYRKIEIQRSQFAGAEITSSLGKLRTQLVLFESTPQGQAAYPAVTLNLFSKGDLEKIRRMFADDDASDAKKQDTGNNKSTARRATTAPILFLLITLSLFTFSTLTAQPNRLSLTSTEETLHNGKVIKSTSERYFDLTAGRIITMAKTPEEFVYISNAEGKAEIYYPSRNARTSSNNLIFSVRNNNLWFFLNNQGDDLGLKAMGFKASGVKNEDNYVITTWQAPVRLLAEVDKVDLVHEDHLPVYLEYRNTKGATTLKVYYSDFQRAGKAMVPTRVTEIIFTSPTDSTIKRSTYTDLQWGDQAVSKGFDFTIPPDARKLK